MDNRQLTFMDLGMEIEPEKEKKVPSSRSTLPEGAVSGSKAMEMLELSRHVFDKLVKDGVLVQHIDGKKKYYLVSELKEFMATEEYKQLAEGTVDKRNPLNDLTGKDWLPETKSFFYQKGLGANHPEAQIVIYGKIGHAEVIGLEGQTNGNAIVIEDENEA